MAGSRWAYMAGTQHMLWTSLHSSLVLSWHVQIMGGGGSHDGAMSLKKAACLSRCGSADER